MRISAPSPRLSRTPPRLASALLLSLVLLGGAHATGSDEASPRYQQPSAEIRAVLDAPSLPTPHLSPDQRSLALLTMRRYRSIAELARPVLGLAGTRIDPGANGPQLVSAIEAISLRDLEHPEAPARSVRLPAGGSFHDLRWSPDGRRFLLSRRTGTATELWVGEVASGALHQLPGVRLNTVLDSRGSADQEPVWLSAQEILVLCVPDKRGAAPQFEAPLGPAIQESMRRVSPKRTLQDLLKSPQDEALFSHYASAVLRRVQLDSGRSQELGEPGLFSQVRSVGTQGLLLTERLLPPFSYQVGWSGFSRAVELRDAKDGRVLREIARVKPQQDLPIEGVVTGARQFWVSPLGEGPIYWVEALDRGDPRHKAPHRDRLMRLDPPYQGAAREMHRTAGRLSSVSFVDGPGQRLLVSEYDRDRKWLSVDLIDADAAAVLRRLQDRSMRDRYADLGTPLARTLSNGRRVLRVDDGHLLLTGAGASPEGDRPFIDSLNLADGKTTRLFQSDSNHYERPLTRLADGRLLSSRESDSEAPHLVLRSGPGYEQSQDLTPAVDPTPQLRAIKRELVKFKRADGVELSFWLYLPPDYQAGERRPTLVWAYPLEYTDASTAGQVSGSAKRFTSFGGTSALMMLLDGYVVLMDATMPVVGDPRTVNNSFIEQISANAQAIIEKAEALGVTERSLMVVGGHSYGAFMTANLLAHTDLFKAGIARSGAYNRTLTPFGFQSERRSYWEAQDVYQRLSPFNYADKLKEPLLLIHGEADDNPGTFPIQSQRFYQALAGTGGQVRFVSLPFESHGYSARESVGHTLWEMSDWIRRHTRDPRAPAKAASQPAQ